MRVAIIGGGAAGLFCAANLTSCQTTIFESRQSCGNKLLLTGGGRCNYTNNSVNFCDGVVCGSKFIKSCMANFGQQDLILWFKQRGLSTEFEGQRAFPSTKKSTSVLNLLICECKKNNVKFVTDCKVKKIEIVGDKFAINNQTFDAVVIATGGKTFSKTGSDGSGNLLLADLGIKTNPYVPKLGPIYASGTKDLQGVSCECGLKLIKGNKIITKTIGPIIFTHFGISGPAALDCCGLANENANYVSVDFIPQISEGEFKEKITNNISAKTLLRTFLSEFVTKSIACKIETSCMLNGKRLCDLNKKDIENVCDSIKNHIFPFMHFADFNESWVSAGGVDLREINPKNMEVKSIKNLFVVGEQLDVFGLCGGYNLQIAFSSAKAVADYLESAK